MRFGPMFTAAATALMLAVAPASAATITFDTVNSGGTAPETGAGTLSNKRTYTSGGITMTAVGYSLTGGVTGPLSNANVGFYSGFGLGVCNSGEGVGCNPAAHQADNLGNKDFILLQFNQAVTIDSLVVKTFSGADTDVLYFVGKFDAAIDLTNKTLLQSALTEKPIDDGTATTNTVTIGGPGVYTAILIGAPTGQSDDAWKLRSVTVSTGPGQIPAPEPASLALLATGLIGLGAAVRHRRKH